MQDMIITKNMVIKRIGVNIMFYELPDKTIINTRYIIAIGPVINGYYNVYVNTVHYSISNKDLNRDIFIKDIIV
jgi:phosphosulfolactate synthase (CoM biosynthesis protein A)